MPLLNFKTDLTSLRFGMDRPGGGDSGQPFIQSPIEDANTPTEFRDFYNLNRTTVDFPIRGGSLSSLINGVYTSKSALIDTERIKKFLSSSPRGVAFVQKQTGLQLTNPRTQVPNTLEFVGLNIGNAVLPTTQVYNQLNTLAQVTVQGNGAHFNRHGVFPTIYESEKQTYQFIAGAPQNNTEVTNRLAILRALKLVGTSNFLLTPNVMGGIGVDPTLVNRMGISTIQNQLFNYFGGPGSVYGVGFTRIFRYTDTDAAKATDTVGFTLNGVRHPYSAIGYTYQQLAEQNTRTTNPDSPVQATIQDFRRNLPVGTPNNPGVPRSDYATQNMITRLGIGDPGKPNARVNYVSYGTRTGEDRLNALNPFYFNPTETDPWSVAKENGKDLIKFAFECIDNDYPTNTVALIFRAFLEGQIQDSNQAEFNTFKYLGRGETFRTYQGFDRTVSFVFKVFVQSRQEMQPLYKKLNHLISQTYPDYSSQYKMMRGNVVNLTIGDYIYRTPGFLESVNVTIDNSNTPWEIALNEFADSPEDDVRQLPHMVTVQCTFKPIMNILPRKQSANTPGNPNSFVPLIANKDRYLDPNADTPSKQKDLTVVNTETAVTPTQNFLIPAQGSGVQVTGINIPQPFIPAGNQFNNSTLFSSNNSLSS